jgi:TetR/AcrR family transcriptional regulator, repressor for uid operon
MPKLKPETQLARREHILDAAEICFAKSGFHGTSMHDICREAAVSPGALYVYFGSKELLISGIAERDRARLQEDFKGLADAPDLLSALQRIGEKYTIEEPRHKRVLLVEIGAEATRNPVVAQIFHSVDRFVEDSLFDVFERARQAGKIRPTLDSRKLAQTMMVVGDGMFWRRAVARDFDAGPLMPTVMAMMASLLNPVDAEAAQARAVVVATAEDSV